MSAIATDEFDHLVDEGADVEEFLDMEHPIVHKAKNPRVVISPPVWLLKFYDDEAERRGIARKAVLNTALVEWADQQRERERALR